MENSQIPVLFDIVERGKNAPDENVLTTPETTGEKSNNEGNESPAKLSSRPGPTSIPSIPDDLDTTDERPVVPKHMLESGEEEEKDKLVDQVMAMLMPQLEALARKTVSEILTNRRKTGDE